MAGLDGDAGAHFYRGPGSQRRGFQGKEVIAEVLAGMRHHRQPGAFFQ